jgi:eukaryotic-like serine/threonine-protein kinase
MIGRTIQELTIVRQIGEGGMGAVYLAEDRVLHTKHVVKILLPQWTQKPDIVDRFVDEARAAAAIRSKNIVAVERCFQVDGQWLIVMEYLEGETLAQRADRHAGPLSPHLIVEIVAGIASGLSAAHKKGIVHRDLKPENIFLTTDEEGRVLVKILDFGIAKLGEGARGRRTRTGWVAGTPAYMAPEQIRDFRSADARADVYALGVVAYQLATGGHLPFQDDETSIDDYHDLSTVEIYERQRSCDPIDPRRHAPSIADAFARAIVRSLEFRPDSRLQSARQLAIALAEATPGDGYAPSGVEIVGRVSSNLLRTDSLHETVRAIAAAPVDAVAPDGDQRPTRSLKTGQPQRSTLGYAASQSVPAQSAPTRRRAAVVALAALGTVGAFAIAYLATTSSRPHDVTTTAPATVASEMTTKIDAGSVAMIHIDAPTPVTPPTDAAPQPVAASPSVDAGTTTPRPVRTPQGPQAPRGDGELVVIVRPWADVWIDGRFVGQTPHRERKITAGRHQIRLRNEDSRKDETATITIAPNQTTQIERAW